MAADRPGADTGPPRDLCHRHGEAFGGERLRCHLENALAIALGISTHKGPSEIHQAGQVFLSQDVGTTFLPRISRYKCDRFPVGDTPTDACSSLSGPSPAVASPVWDRILASQ